MKGPLSRKAVEKFAAKLTEMAGREMELDLETPGTQIQEDWGRYPFKVKGGRMADFQGVRLNVSIDPKVELIRHNRIYASIYIHLDHKLEETLEEVLLNRIDVVLSSAYTEVVRELMEPYEGPHKKSGGDHKVSCGPVS